MVKHNKKERNCTDRFVMIHHSELLCPAFQALSGDEVKIYLAMRSRYNGRNNCNIPFSSQEAGDVINKSKQTGARCILRLERFGFVKVRVGARYNFEQKRKCREYELTAIARAPARKKDRLPYGTKDFMQLTRTRVNHMVAFEKRNKQAIGKTKSSNTNETASSTGENRPGNVVYMKRN